MRCRLVAVILNFDDHGDRPGAGVYGALRGDFHWSAGEQRLRAEAVSIRDLEGVIAGGEAGSPVEFEIQLRAVVRGSAGLRNSADGSRRSAGGGGSGGRRGYRLTLAVDAECRLLVQVAAEQRHAEILIVRSADLNVDILQHRPRVSCRLAAEIAASADAHNVQQTVGERWEALDGCRVLHENQGDESEAGDQGPHKELEAVSHYHSAVANEVRR